MCFSNMIYSNTNFLEQPIEDPDGRENVHSEDTNEAFWVLTNSGIFIIWKYNVI